MTVRALATVFLYNTGNQQASDLFNRQKVNPIHISRNKGRTENHFRSKTVL